MIEASNNDPWSIQLCDFCRPRLRRVSHKLILAQRITKNSPGKSRRGRMVETMANLPA
jgi:hypothetical protein